MNLQPSEGFGPPFDQVFLPCSLLTANQSTSIVVKLDVNISLAQGVHLTRPVLGDDA